MRKIGLLCGTCRESTPMYYKGLNTRIGMMTNVTEMPDIAVESVNFRRAWGYVASGQYGLLADYLAEKVNSLRLGGAEIISLTAGTMHIVLDELLRKTQVPLVSIPQAVCREAQARGYRKIGLLGTIFTMEQDYMKTDFRKAGIEVVIPDKAERELVAKRILEELEIGVVKESTLREFQGIIRGMREKDGIEAVVLGCTELPLLLNAANCPVPCLDSVEIHINELIRLAV